MDRNPKKKKKRGGLMELRQDAVGFGSDYSNNSHLKLHIFMHLSVDVCVKAFI